MHHPLSIWL